MQWYYFHKNEWLGPCDEHEIVAKAARGEIPRKLSLLSLDKKSITEAEITRTKTRTERAVVMIAAVLIFLVVAFLLGMLLEYFGRGNANQLHWVACKEPVCIQEVSR